MATGDNDNVASEVSSIYLRSSGKLYNKQVQSGDDGLLSTMWNYPLKGLLWKLYSATFNKKNDQCIMYDERGQIYAFSIKQNKYSTVHLASSPISSMAYVLSQPSQIIAAYENGDILLLDTESDSSVHIGAQCPSMTVATIRIIKSHPSKPIMALSSDDKVVSLWDIRTKQCLRNLRCEENILDIKFEFAGDILTVAQELSGACSYRTDNCKPVAQYLLQSTERCPKWTAYESYLNKSRSHQHVVLGGDNGMLYVWGAVHTDNLTGNCRIVDCMGTVELPVQMRVAVSIQSIGISSGSVPRLAVLSSEGDVAIIEIEVEAVEVLSVLGSCTVMAYIKISSSIGLPLAPFTVPCQRRSAHGNIITGVRHSTGTLITPTISSSAKNRSNLTRSSSENILQLQKLSAEEIDKEDSSWTDSHSSLPRHGRMDSCGKYLLLIGSDGAARIYDTEKSVGHGSIAGSMLRTRNIVREETCLEPYGGQSRGRKQSSGMIEVQKRRAAKEKKQKESILKGKGGLGSRGDSMQRGDKNTDAVLGGTLDLAQKSLFELAEMSPKGREVNALKLSAYLNQHGQFPAQYRSLIWRFLLRLPGNIEEFSSLVLRGTHPAYTTLNTRYTMGDKKFVTRLQGTCSLLTHWSPIFSEIPYLPEMVAPFVNVFGCDEIAALEAVMSVLMWWGHSFHATFPHPPVHIMDSIDDVIKIHDPALHLHLNILGIRSGFLGWSLLKSLFSQILDKNSWSQWMDHLLLHFHRCEITILAPVAIIIAARTALIASQRVEDITHYMNRTQSFNMKNLTRTLTKLLRTTDSKHLTSVGGFADLALKHGLENLDLDSTQKLRANTAASVGVPVLTLPKGRYPAYDGYPVYVVDWEIKERERIILQAAQLDNHNTNLTQQKEQLRNIENDHATWTSKYLAAAENSMRLQEGALKREQEEDRQALRMEKENSSHRLLALSTVDRITMERVAIMNSIAEKQQALLAAANTSSKTRLQAVQELSNHRQLAEKAGKLENEKLSTMALSVAKEQMAKFLLESYGRHAKESGSVDRWQAAAWANEDQELRRERERILSVLEDIENQQRVLIQRGEVSEIILKIDHEKGMKSATLLADRNARIAADKALTAQLHLLAVQQQQIIDEKTKTDRDVYRQKNKKEKIKIEDERVESNLERIQQNNAEIVMLKALEKGMENKMGDRVIDNKEEEKTGRRMYENSVRLQQEENENLLERKDAYKIDRLTESKAPESKERTKYTATEEKYEPEQMKADKEKRLTNNGGKKGVMALKEKLDKIEKQYGKIGLDMSRMQEEEEVEEEEKRGRTSLNAVDVQMEITRREKIIDHENERVRVMRERQQDTQNEDVKFRKVMMLKSDKMKSNNDTLAFNTDVAEERELRKERRKEEKEADLRVIRDARERSEAIKKKEKARKREELEYAKNEGWQRIEGAQEQSRVRSLEETGTREKQGKAKATMRMNDNRADFIASEGESLTEREEGERDMHDDDESVSVTSLQSDASSVIDDNAESNCIIHSIQEDIDLDREIEQKINSQIVAEKITFRGEYDMSGAGGYKRGAPIPGVRVLSKAQIKEELRKVSTAAARSVSAVRKQRISDPRSTPKSPTLSRPGRLEDLSADNSPYRDRMVREMHMSKYRVRSTSRPPAPPIRVPDRKSNASSRDTERSLTREHREVPQGMSSLNRIPSTGHRSAPVILSGTRDDSVRGRGQESGGRGSSCGQAYVRGDVDDGTSPSKRHSRSKAVLSVRSDSINEGVGGKKTRGKEGDLVEGKTYEYVDDVRARTRIAKSTDMNNLTPLDDNNSMSMEGGGTGTGEGGGVRDASEGIVWIDGAPYSDLISSTTSRHRGPRRAANVFPSSAFPVGYGTGPVEASHAPSSSTLSSDPPHPYPHPYTHSSLIQRDDRDGLKDTSVYSATLSPRAYPSNSFYTEEDSSESSSSFEEEDTSRNYHNLGPKEGEYASGSKGGEYASGLKGGEYPPRDYSVSRTDTSQYEKESSLDSSYEVQAFIPSNDTLNKRNKQVQRFSSTTKAILSTDKTAHSSSSSSSSSSIEGQGQGRGKAGPVLMSPTGNQKASRKSSSPPQTLDPHHTAHSMPSTDFYHNLQQLADMSVRAVQDVLEESRQERALEARVLQRKSA